MKIKEIKLKNYRAFYGEYNINVNGKNLLIYGENGSGKSSLYYAIKDFFEASVNQKEINKNIFTDDESFIEISFFDTTNRNKKNVIKIDDNEKFIQDILVTEANKIKSFFDYKKLLKTHFIDTQKVDIFDLLIKDILFYSINEITENRLGEEWLKINELKKENRNSPKFKECEVILENFNKGLKSKLVSIKDLANQFINYFGYGIEIDFEFSDIKIYGKQKEFQNNEIILKIKFFDKSIDKHHTFFNEARLTALGISLYLASVLNNPLGIDFKIMFLDDILIGLDMSNRIPFVNILNEHFKDFQIIFTTYDKAWFELLKGHFNEKEWKYIEIYSKKINNFEMPIIYQDNLIQKAEKYFEYNDYKASAVYLRSEFEKILKDFCHKKHLKVKYYKQPFKNTSEDFWEAVKEYTNLNNSIIEKIELYRSIVMNPISHYTIEKPEFKNEIKETIEEVKKLKKALKSVEIITTSKLREENEELKKRLKNCNQTLDSVENILDKIQNIKTTFELNQFLQNEILPNVLSFDLKKLEILFDELRLRKNLNLFDLATEAILIRIFALKEWNIDEKKLWCAFVQYLYNQNKINEPLLIQKLEEKNTIKKVWGGWNNQEELIDCDFLDSEIPF